jgi:hypothetical protein
MINFTLAAPIYDEMRYVFHPRIDPFAPGYPGLDLVLKDISVERGCQPHSLQINVADPDEIIRHLTVFHGLRLDQDRYRVCAGRFLVFEQNGQVMQVFTFGGTLSLEPAPDLTHCTITSAAPLIPLQMPHCADNIPCLLVEAVEKLLAQRQAQWSARPEAYLNLLAQADPLSLYFVCLNELRHRISEIAPHDTRESLRAFVIREIHALQARGEWPLRVCTFDEIL